MALLSNSQHNQRALLRPVHVLGRAPQACHTHFDAVDVSKLHAQIQWSDGKWEICDLSHNGTWQNGQRITPGQWVALLPDASLRFSAHTVGHWQVINLDPPCTSLLSANAELAPIALQPKGSYLPDANTPQATIYVQAGNWVLEHAGGVDILQDGKQLEFDNQRWEFVLCNVLSATLDTLVPMPPTPIELPHFHLHISQNEEHATLCMHLGANQWDLGERIHHYTLATLARKRLQDANCGLDAHSQGWLSLDRLATMLGVDRSYANIQIFRAREQIIGALCADRPHAASFPPLVERRRGEVRFGAYTCSIYKGSHEEGSLPAGHAARSPTTTQSEK